MLLKIISIFSVVRGYNIGLVVLAQYLTSIFILAHDTPMIEVLLDPSLFVLVLATVGAIASGYIINNFYDQEKDLINRPQKSILDPETNSSTCLLYPVFTEELIILNGKAMSDFIFLYPTPSS